MKLKFFCRIVSVPSERREMRSRLFGLAADQAGYFAAAQAKEIGYSYQAQAHHVGAGNWVRVDRGLFRLADWVAGEHDDLARWTLWSGGRGVISHVTALAVHEIGEFESGRIHMTVPPGFNKRTAAVTLHQAELPRHDVVSGRGFTVTTPLRSIIDIAATAPDQDQLSRLIAEALGRGMLTVRTLRSRAEEIDVHAALYIERALPAATAR